MSIRGTVKKMGEAVALARKYRARGRIIVVSVYKDPSSGPYRCYRVNPAGNRRAAATGNKPSKRGPLWKDSDIRQVLGLVKSGASQKQFDKLAEKLGRSTGSVSAKASNIRAIMTGKGFPHAREATERVVRGG